MVARTPNACSGNGSRRSRPSCIPSKWQFAIGTTSRVPGSNYLHYLILDIDRATKAPAKFMRCEQRWQKTQSGWHLYTPWQMSFQDFLMNAEVYGADKKWLTIAEKRGYAFLADKKYLALPWPVERMVIGARD
jgi:hypothetical protein